MPAPETNHAIAAVIEEAKRAKEEGEPRVILLIWSGHGLIDLSSYDAYLSGKLKDVPMDDEQVSLLCRDLKRVGM